MGYCKHCKKPANNVGNDLCNDHIDALRKEIREKEQLRIAEIKKTHFYIPDGTDVGEGDGYVFTSFQVNDAIGVTIEEFLESVTISEIDQDGGDVDCLNFWDAPTDVQDIILDLAGIKWDDIKEVG